MQILKRKNKYLIMWNKFKLWLKENTSAFIVFTAIIVSSIIILLTVNKWILFSLLIVFYVGWIGYKVYKNQKL